MPAIMSPPAGTFCWPELCTTDSAEAKRFYGALFGWAAEDLHMPEGDYTIFKLNGQNVGAMYQTGEDRVKAGVRPHWNSYVAVTDADEAVVMAAANGGQVLMPVFDAGDAGRMANLQDPTGAKFSIYEAKASSEPTCLYEVGALCWSELYTNDTDKAAAFYSALFGWRPMPFGDSPMPYTVFHLAEGDMGVGGMMSIPPGMTAEPHWLPYFLVADADRTAAQTQELGGSTCNPPMDVPTVGRIAMLADAQGAPFAIIKPIRQG